MLQYRKRAWAEISLNALEENVRAIQARLEDTTEYCAVVKADAYGHGEKFICQKLYEMGIRFYAVSSFEEAVRVRGYCPEGEILILGYTAPECAPLLAEYDILQAVVSLEYAKELASFAEHAPVRCHVALDTGMGRIGLKASETELCTGQLKEISSLSGLKLEGLFTHFAVADEDDAENIAYTVQQQKTFFTVANAFQKETAPLKHVHCMNSAAILYRNMPESTLARAGIIMYGLMPNANLAVPLELKPVLSFKSRISHIKEVHAGDCISYGRTYQAKETRKIATVTIGYADGYSRLLSNKGEMLVNGIRCHITGRVCMDQTMIDVTDVPDVKAGTVVTLIGSDGQEQITADDLAGMYGTIGYETVCDISKRVPRIFLQDGKMIHEDSLI